MTLIYQVSVSETPNSLTIQDKAQPGANPGTGITLPGIAPGETLTLTLQVLVREAPAEGAALRPYLIAQTILRYQFRYPDGRIEKQSASSNTIFVEMADFDGSVE